MVKKYCLEEERKDEKDWPLVQVANTRLKVIKQPSTFVDLRKNGKKVFVNNWLIAVCRKSDEFELGISVSSKDANAVVRNRLKRWAKEFFRRNQINGFKLLLIFRSKQTPLNKIDFRSFNETTNKIIDRVTAC
jgi:ribonuclease P protein component